MGPQRKPLLEVNNLSVQYPVRSSVVRKVSGYVQAVKDVSFKIYPGQTLALVGESGCGKSSTARSIVGLEKISDGSIVFRDKEITTLSATQQRQLTREVQFVFQDPHASLNPRLTVRQILQEGWRIHRDMVPKKDWDEETFDLLSQVGLNSKHADRYPHQFSGGQRQRIGIARALSMRPSLLVLDEPVSALDVSVQAQILNLLDDLRKKFDLSYLFISHDLNVVRHLSDDIAVMHRGEIVEYGPNESVFSRPQHEYTKELLSASPVTYPWRLSRSLSGN